LMILKSNERFTVNAYAAGEAYPLAPVIHLSLSHQ
jgi:hypothetical protein